MTLRRQRKQRGWTIVELSRRMFLAGYRMSPAVIYNTGHGLTERKHGTITYRVRMISCDEACAFAEVFGILVTELLKGDDE